MTFHILQVPFHAAALNFQETLLTPACACLRLLASDLRLLGSHGTFSGFPLGLALTLLFPLPFIQNLILFLCLLSLPLSASLT